MIQHLSWVTSVVDWDEWSETSVDAVEARVGRRLAVEVLALMAVLSDFGNSGVFLWAASETAAHELAQMQGQRALAPQRQWADLRTWWDDMVWEWPEELGHTIDYVEPNVSPDQLAFELVPEPAHVHPGTAPLGPFRDLGDRGLIREAARRGFRSILTTDLRSLWAHRSYLYPKLEIWRPSDVMRSFGGSPECLLNAERPGT